MELKLIPEEEKCPAGTDASGGAARGDTMKLALQVLVKLQTG